MTLIAEFKGEHAFLSNFWIEPFECGGRIVPSSEHAFQAQKANKGETATRELILSACNADGTPSPGHAKRLGKRVKLRPDWDEVKVPIMRKILASKFSEGSELAAKLVATHPAQLVEGNTWGDAWWGCTQPTPGGAWIGSNHLGILLMQRRDELMASA